MSKSLNHLAIILDGNGRWARNRGLPRNLGHYNGANNLFRIAAYANTLGIKTLTVYAFSSENWDRPQDEVEYLMTEPKRYLEKNMNKLNDIDYVIKFVGRKSKIPKDMEEVIEKLESQTEKNSGMTLQIAFDYGSKEELINAFSKAKKPYTEESLRKHFYVKEDVDLLIRTSGEMRLSNFLLWQSSYAEFLFVKKHWPAFTKKDLDKAIKEYYQRNRRFGKL